MIRLLCLISLGLALTAAEGPRINLDLRNKPLVQAIASIGNQLRAHVLADADCTERLAEVVDIQVVNQDFAEVVTLIRQRQGLVLDHVEGMLRIRSAETLERKAYRLQHYDVRALLTGMSAFPGPDLDIPEPGGTGTCLAPRVADDVPPELDEFTDLIMTQITPEIWDNGIAAIDEYRGMLAITATPATHAAIADLLLAHERLIGRLVVCRVYQVAVPADPRPVLDAAAATALIQDGRRLATFVCANGQQNHHFSGEQQQIIADANVVQGVFDPILSTIADGLVVDVSPTITVGGVLADLRLSEVIPGVVRSRPIGGVAGTTQVRLDLPRQRQHVQGDERLIPPGGAALILAGDHAYALTFTPHGG